MWNKGFFMEIMVDYGKHKQGTHSTKMSADKLAQNTPNVPKIICPDCLPSPKLWDFDEKMLHWASVVRGPEHIANMTF